MNNLNLMIGDWMSYEGKPCKISMLNNDELPINIKPIPLTPKVLEKIEGCKKCFRIDSGEYKECYEVDFALGLMIRHNSYYIDWIGGNTEVKYLHTLQQFIRLFTNKEIEIEWEK